MNLKIVTVTLAALAMTATVAEAQNARSRSDSNSNAGAFSSSQSAGGQVNSTIAAQQGVYIDQRSPGRVTNDTAIRYSGNFDQRTVPGVIAPALAAGVNSCAVSASVGGSVLGTGLTGGAAWSDKSCERRAEAAALAGLGYPDLAMRHLARDPEVYQTLVDAGIIVNVARAAPPPAGINPKQGQVVAGGYSGKVKAAAPVCYVKPGTTRTIITNAPTQEGKMACARSLGKR